VRSQEQPDGRLPRFLSVAEIAEIFGVSEVTIYREISDGGLPAVKIRGRYVVPAKAVDRLEAEALACSSSTASAADEESSIEVA
jgi:excisionase family DNA binding protein